MVKKLKKQINWADLKAFANGLNKEQLAQPIRWWGEETGGTARFGQLEEDYISDGEGYNPKSSYGADMPDEEDIEGVMPMGTPIIFVD